VKCGVLTADAAAAAAAVTGDGFESTAKMTRRLVDQRLIAVTLTLYSVIRNLTILAI